MSIYGCHNKPRPTANAPLPVQDGWYKSAMSNTRYPRMAIAPYAMSTACQYSQQQPNDSQCAGCQNKFD